MSKSIDHVPSWVRITVGILALLNIAFGVAGYFDIGVLFHSGTGIDLSNSLIKNASFEFAARNLAIGLALGFVTIIRGAPEALIILTITRAFVDMQTIIISIVQGNINTMLLVPFAFLVVEILIVKTLIPVIKKEEAQMKN
jgi:hypothetical protein